MILSDEINYYGNSRERVRIRAVMVAFNSRPKCNSQKADLLTEAKAANVSLIPYSLFTAKFIFDDYMTIILKMTPNFYLWIAECGNYFGSVEQEGSSNHQMLMFIRAKDHFYTSEYVCWFIGSGHDKHENLAEYGITEDADYLPY